MSFDDGSDEQQWFEELEEYFERRAEETAAELEGGEEEFLEHLRELGIDPTESEPDEPDEDVTEAVDEFVDDDSAVNIDDIEDDPHNAPDNEIQEGWERVYHFDFAPDGRNFIASLPVGPLWLVYLEDGSVDIYVDRDYEGAAA